MQYYKAASDLQVGVRHSNAAVDVMASAETGLHIPYAPLVPCARPVPCSAGLFPHQHG